MDPNRDEQLWQLAKKRASFQRNLVAYFVVNAFLWLIWRFTTNSSDRTLSGHTPWPVWVMLGWGLGLVFHYFSAYGGDKNDLANKEYEKLKKQKENNNR